jgi:CubicO group peptidase (beta-lactamase class C family)
MHPSHVVRALLFGALLLAPLGALVLAENDHAAIKTDELSARLEKARAKYDVPALAAAIIRPGHQPVVAVVGVRQRGTDTAATAADQWHLGSNTKPITALLIALLIDLGLLDWDTPLEQIFPEHADKWSPDLKKITPQHLLTHTSGLPNLGPIQWFLLGNRVGSPAQDRARLVKDLSTVKLSAAPGKKYGYSNLGYSVLGAIIDRRGNASWETQVEQKVFGPLGIKHWGLGPMDNQVALKYPWPHQSNGKPVAPDGVMDNPPVMNSAGRIHMSVADYNRFLAETLKLARGERGLVKQATAQKMFSNSYPVSPHSLSGWLGFRKDPAARGLVLQHDGSNTLNYCTAVVMPDLNLALCVFTNQGTVGGPGARVCQDIRTQIRSLAGSPPK